MVGGTVRHNDVQRRWQLVCQQLGTEQDSDLAMETR